MEAPPKISGTSDSRVSISRAATAAVWPSISPSAIQTGSPNTTITVTGANFVTGTTVNLDGATLGTVTIPAVLRPWVGKDKITRAVNATC